MYNFVLGVYGDYKRIIRYLISGGTAALTDLVLLYILADKLGIWYMYSVVLAFAVAFFVSFFLQKFWTFEDNGTSKAHRQITVYILI